MKHALVLFLCALASLPLAAAGKTVKIGAIFAVTGPASFLGAPEQKTAQMLVDEINAKGGVNGDKLALIIKDSEGSPEKAVSFAKQLIDEEKVFAIIGPTTSGESLAIKKICEEGKTILISCAAADAIVNPLASWVFKTPQKDSDVVKWIYDTMKKKGLTKIGVLSANTGFGKSGKAQLEALATNAGITILISEVFDKQATDLTSVLTKIKAMNVQAIVNWSIEPAQSIIPKNMKQINMNVPLFQSHGFGNVKYATEAGKAGEGIVFPCGRIFVADQLADKDPQKAVLQKYKKDYETKFKEDVSTFGGHAYDAILILTEGMKKAGSADKAKVRAAIENIKGLAGTAGVFNYSATDHSGLGMDSLSLLTVKDGKFVLYKE
ncbi:MAG: ABC transporter substrate-binding protein [Spirochaetes bacterium]|nr:ABC transporter substrate-binding protein [Spirochaetota bacterium]